MTTYCTQGCKVPSELSSTLGNGGGLELLAGIVCYRPWYESVPDLLLGLIDCVDAVSKDMHVGVVVQNQDLPCPLLIFDETEAVAGIVCNRCLGFGFLLNPVGDTKEVLGIFGYPGLLLFWLIGHLHH